MLDLDELKQFVAFADSGTLSRVAEEFHISTPSITRSMKHVEEGFGVSLFHRGKNKIELNETGTLAVMHARRLLQEAEQAVQQVQAFDAKRKTIVVKSCAPAPLWELLRKLSDACPDMTISSKICQNEEVLQAWEEGTCDIAILPFPIETEKGEIREFMQEHLFACVPKEHALAKHKTLHCAEMNGFNFLLRSQLGFWDTLCREKMPASKFLVQTDESVFHELVNASSLPCFTTDYIQNRDEAYHDRVNIPILDAEVNVTFYILMPKSKSGFRLV